MHRAVASLDKERFDVKMRMKHVLDYGGENRELWNHLERRIYILLRKTWPSW
jgi:type I restriction enzyme, R subunit